MTKVNVGTVRRKRHKKILALAKGYRGRNSTCYRIALQKVMKGMQYAYRDRRNKKRDFRRLWIQRINAALRTHNKISYSRFVWLSQRFGVELNRKMLSEIAIHHPKEFTNLVDMLLSKYVDAGGDVNGIFIKNANIGEISIGDAFVDGAKAECDSALSI